MEASKRSSKQQQIGNTGQYQLAARLSEYGWMPGSIHPDMGEDFIVRIQDDYVPNGLDFYVQDKSTSRLDKRGIQGGDISCQIEVKDLKAWDVKAIPVFIFVWDINEKSGYWISVTDAIAELDKRLSLWRDKKTVQVRIPGANRTDDAGLHCLRQLVGHYYFPLVSKGKRLTITATFEFSGPEAKPAEEALKRHLAKGDEVEIDGKFVKELRLPDWWLRLFGKPDPVRGSLKLSPMPSQENHPFRLDVDSLNCIYASIPHVEMRTVKGGQEEVTLSNEQQVIPYKIRLVVERSGWFHFTIGLIGDNLNVQEERELLHLMSALAAGGRMRMTPLASDTRLKPYETDFDPGFVESPDPKYVQLIEKLCVIERETRCGLTLPDRPITSREIRIINELITIFETGHVVQQAGSISMNTNGPVDPEASVKLLEEMLQLHESGEPLSFTVDAKETSVELFGVQVPTGQNKKHITGRLAPSAVRSIKRAIPRLGPNSSVKLALMDVQIVDEYTRWLRAQ